MNDRLSAEQWSDFWQAGSITTFFQRFANNYDSAILAFWKEVFERQPKDACVVDLATGNGAVALLAAQFSDAFDQSFTVTGVDYAATDPKAMLRGERPGTATLDDINFLINTRIEETGLADAGFDLAVSQFGFEYADSSAAVSELDRILKPRGAVFAAMIHVQGSAIMHQAKEGIRQAKQCDKAGLIEPAEKLLQALDRAEQSGADPAEDKACESLRQTINKITGVLHSAQSQFKDPGQIAWFLTNTMSLFSKKKTDDMDLEEKVRLLQSVKPEAAQYQQRMKDLMSAAQSPEQIAALEKALIVKGFTIDASDSFDFEGVYFCHALVASR